MSQLSFDLTTPDPEFPGFTVRLEDQLSGRPLKGEIEIATFFRHLKLFFTEAQQQGPVNGGTIFDHLKANSLPVFGPNVGQFLFERQELIPVELRGKVVLVFWGKVYRDSGDGRYVRCLYWYGRQWMELRLGRPRLLERPQPGHDACELVLDARTSVRCPYAPCARLLLPDSRGTR